MVARYMGLQEMLARVGAGRRAHKRPPAVEPALCLVMARPPGRAGLDASEELRSYQEAGWYREARHSGRWQEKGGHRPHHRQSPMLLQQRTRQHHGE
jgi:hypothetical protein